MLVLVEDAAESITSADVEVVESVRFGDRFGQWAEGCGAVQGAVGPVLVVEGLELAECVQEVGLVPDQGAVEEFGSAGRTQRSMIEFMRGTRMPVVTTSMPSSSKTASKARVYLLSRSRIRYFT